MAVGKEIRGKISSIKNTQKITKAMELVAASKMRRAQERMLAGKAYANGLWSVISHVAQANTELSHPWFGQRQVRNVGYVVVSTDRGLCGGLNINLFRSVAESMAEWEGDGVKHRTTAIGRKAAGFFQRSSDLVSSEVNLPDAPTVDNLLAAVHVQIETFNQGGIDKLFLASNEFINSMLQKPRLVQLLPLHALDSEVFVRAHKWDYLYEPGAEQLLGNLLERYLEVQVYQAVIENIACEQAARMLAMKSATDNAGELIDDLLLVYNKARQAAITQEISEIVGGAAAI